MSLPKTLITFIRDKELAKNFNFNSIANSYYKSRTLYKSSYDAQVAETDINGLFYALSKCNDMTIICGYPIFNNVPIANNSYVNLLSEKKFERDYPEITPHIIKINDSSYIATRTKDNFKPNSIFLADVDICGDAPQSMQNLSTQDILNIYNSVTDNLFDDVLVLDVASSSNGLISPSGQPLTSHDKRHLYMQVVDPADIERFVNVLYVKLINAGYYYFNSDNALKTFVDKQAVSSEHVCYEATPIYKDGLTSNRAKPVLTGNKLLYTTRLADLTDEEIQTYSSITGKNLKSSKSSKSAKGSQSFSSNQPNRVNDLKWDTVIKLSNGATMTIQEFKDRGLTDEPCHSPFRLDNNPSAKIGIDKDGNPYCYDASTNTTHFIEQKHRVVTGELVDNAVVPTVSEHDIYDVYSLSDGLKFLDSKYAIVLNPKKCLIMEKDSFNESLNINQVEFLAIQAFNEFHSEKKVSVNNKLVSLTKLWFEHKQTVRFSQIVFNPLYDAKVSPTTFNLFRGLEYKPKKGNWRRFIHHIYQIVCDGDKKVTRYVIAWMANMVQGKPKPGVAIVLQGEKGTGKSIFVTSFGRLFGRNFVPIVQSKQLVGNFNDHLKEAFLVFAEEAFWAGDKQAESALKALITEDIMMIEKKCHDAYVIKNYTNIIFATNNEWSVPASKDERRYCVLKVNNKVKQNHAYFAKLNKLMLEQGGTEAMLYDLLKYNLDDTNLREAPVTEALTEQKYHNDAMLQFLIRCIENGSFYSERKQVEEVYKDVPVPWGSGIVTKDIFREQYSEFAKSSGHRYIENDNIITKKIKDWIPNLNNTTKPIINGIQTPSYKFPSIQQCKASIDKQLGHTWDWT
jgi:hypothetical protein